MLLTTEGLTKQFGKLTAVDNIDFGVEEGKLKSVIGPNGAGKTTFFNLLTGGLTPTSGTVTFRGRDLSGMAPHERTNLGLGRSFQITNIFPDVTVLENVQVAALRSLKRPWNFWTPRNRFSDVLDRSVRALERVDLDDVQDQQASNLSHGDKRRLEIAITLATDPDLLLLDEPTAGMSPEETDDTIELIHEVGVDHTILLIEHDMDVVADVSDEIMVLHQGAKLIEGDPETVLNDREVQEAYLGGI